MPFAKDIPRALSKRTLEKKEATPRKLNSAKDPRPIHRMDLDLLHFIRTVLDHFERRPSESADLTPVLRSIKSDFVQRDYQGVFMGAYTERLLAYFEHYVPSRVLAYFHLFETNPDLRERMIGSPDSESNEVKVLSIGAGACSEVISLHALFHRQSNKDRRLHQLVYDMADWAPLIQQVSQALNETWPIQSEVRFQQKDVLSFYRQDSRSPGSSDLETFEKEIQSFQFITFMFVLNELFATCKRRTVQLLTTLVNNMQPGAHLLVVESAGSFSEVQVGQQTSMVYRLLDHIHAFQCVLSRDAEWYRFPLRLNHQHGFKLNNMRYFIRLYQKKVNQGR